MSRTALVATVLLWSGCVSPRSEPVDALATAGADGEARSDLGVAAGNASEAGAGSGGPSVDGRPASSARDAADERDAPPTACPGGFQACGNECVDPLSVNHCGPSCMRCPSSPNGAAFCDGQTCKLACSAGYHLCDGACASDHDAATCGSACTPCQTAPGTIASCDGQACGFRCAAGMFKCDSQCKDASATSCGNRVLTRLPQDKAPPLPANLKLTCLANPDTLDFSDCPVLRWGSYTYWALADLDNSFTMYIVAFGASGAVARTLTKPGARYLWKITFEDDGLRFHGQDSKTVTASWDELRIDQQP